MKKINPKLILPIIAVMIMVFQEASGLEFSATELQVINDAVLAIIALTGIFANPNLQEENDNNE